MRDLISRQAAIDALDEQIEQCNKSLSSFDISMKDEYAVKVERASLVAFREILEYLPPAQLGTNLAEVGTDMISRAKAIETLTKDKKALEHIINRMSGYEKEFDRFVGQRNQVDYDIYAIKQLPPALPEPMKIDLSRCSEDNWERIKKEWANTPITTIAAEPERIRGRWIEHDDGLTACECSVCHEKYNLYEEDVFGRNFCPNCGADMREDGENSEIN